MQVAVVTFDGFNELDSFIASALINRCRRDGLTAYITTPAAKVTSMNGVEITGQRPLEFAAEADVVLIGSGIKTRDAVADEGLISALPLGPEAARAAVEYVAPVGEQQATVERVMAAIRTSEPALR